MSRNETGGVASTADFRGDSSSACSPDSGAGTEVSTRSAQVSSVILLGEVRFHREALVQALSVYEDIALIGSVVDVYAAILLAEDTRAAVLLVDSPSVAVSRALATHSLDSRLVFIGAASGTDRQIAGLDGAIFVNPTSSIDELHVALRFAALRPFVTRSLPSEPPRIAEGANVPLARLTLREREVSRFVAQGCSNKEIASACGISLATVKNHVHQILAKLSLQRRSQVGRFTADSPAEVPGRRPIPTGLGAIHGLRSPRPGT